MRTRFKARALQRVYETMLRDPPPERQDGVTLGGSTLASAFNAGRKGIQGIHRGAPGTLVRAAWVAGRDSRQESD